MHPTFLKSWPAVALCALLGGAGGKTAGAPAPQAIEGRGEAVNVVRLINTAELAYHSKHGHYANWEQLLTSPEFSQTKSQFDLAGATLTAKGDVIPGYSLRLLTAADQSTYTVSVRETADPCSFSFYSDEQGLILEARAIGCGPPK